MASSEERLGDTGTESTSFSAYPDTRVLFLREFPFVTVKEGYTLNQRGCFSQNTSNLPLKWSSVQSKTTKRL